jgi:hypothetical protein
MQRVVIRDYRPGTHQALPDRKKEVYIVRSRYGIQNIADLG